MGKTLDFTNYIGRSLLNLMTSRTRHENMQLHNLKTYSYKETILNIIPVQYDQGRIIDLGSEVLLNPYSGFIFINYRGIIITNKYVYPFYQVGTIEIEEIKVGHLIYKIEGNLWVKQ